MGLYGEELHQFEEKHELHMFVNEIFHGILHFSTNYSEPFNFHQVGTVIPDVGAVRLHYLWKTFDGCQAVKFSGCQYETGKGPSKK